MLRQFAVGVLSATVLVVSASAATFTVTTTADSGAGSFDQAIIDANANPGLDNIHFNIGGGGAQVITTGAIPVITDAVVIDGTTQPGYAGTPIVTLDGNDTVGAELRIQSASPSTVRGLAIVDMLGAGIRVESGGATITGNYIGVDASGLVADGNLNGIEVREQVDGVIITGNVISGNAANGVQFSGTTGVAASDNNVVQGNIIGLDAQGVNDLGNGINGIAVDGGNNNQFGGTAAGQGNVISGNGGYGIRITGRGAVITGAVGNSIQGNLIGTNAAGTAAVGNTNGGVGLFGAHQTSIGGATAGARNVISGNTNNGVGISFDTSAGTRLAEDTVILGNFIGTDITGTADLGNLINGVLVTSATGTIIGGAAAGAGNVISGNDSAGISITQITSTPNSGSVVQGNRIGTDVTGTVALPNTSHGVVIGSFAGATALSFDHTIGGTGAGEGNQIWFNGGHGVALFTGISNPILGNSIDLNGGLGIEISPIGANPNDPGDADTGPNNRQNAPVLTAVTVTTSTTVTGTLNSTPGRTFRVELFGSPAPDPSGFGEGRTFLGFVTVTTDSAGNAAFAATLPAVPAGSVVTATATDQTTQDTSEFSNAVAAVFVPAAVDAIPTLTEWLLVLMAALLAAAGVVVVRGSAT